MAADPAPRTTRHGARRVAWLLVGVLLGAALLVALPRAPAPTPGAADRADRAGPATGATPVAAPTPAPDGPAADAAPIAPRPMDRANLAIELGGDLHALAVALLPQAEAGDADARYGLHRIIDTCELELRRIADAAALARRRDELLSRAVGVQGAAVAALDAERFAMCDGFRRDPLARFGDDEAWFRQALAQGHPLAEVQAAIAPALDPAFDAARSTPETERARARARLAGALRSGRPEALWLAFAFDVGEAEDGRQWAPTPEAVAWMIVACSRGYACGREARWRREMEAFGGQPAYDDPADALLFDLPAWQHDAARARAAELDAALARGDVEAIMPASLRGTPP